MISTAPRIVLDGAHNREGIEALVAQLGQETDVTVLVSILADKDREAMIEALASVATVYETTFDFARARTMASLRADGANVVAWETWIDDWMQAPRSETLVVTGSLYFISNVRNYFQSFQK